MAAQMLARWVSLPENSSAQLAVERVLECLCNRGRRRALNPLFLHGPAGTGKTHLVSGLVAEASRRCPDLTASLLAAGDFEGLLRSEEAASDLRAAREADLLIVEDLQHLSPRAAEAFAGLVDHRLGRERQLVFTALTGPAQLLALPARLTSRLGSGLVVGLRPLSPEGRRTFLRERVGQGRLSLNPDVLGWLAEHVGGSVRQLEGAVNRLEALARLDNRALSLEEVADTFQVEAEARRLTVERIAQRVGDFFQVEPEQMQSRRRSRNALLPRQVGMYLARQLTDLSLQQIGAYFGGRDHTTVLHACRKVEQALTRDVTLSGAVRQLHADLA